ncbi:stress response protein ElaB [Serratia fonticola]|uniref:stress response protein ElaB n=1 Tax=Serratia fonticola TaxID=47917 RepID=UPI003AABE796
MAINRNENQTTLDDDLRMLSDTLQDVLDYSGDRADQAYTDIKAHAERALKDIKSRLANSSECYYVWAKEVACRADDYVRDKPWHSVGIGATVGLVLGLLLARK